MRILWIGYFLESNFGGAEIVGRQLIAQLRRRGHEVVAACLGRGPVTIEEPVCRLPVFDRLWKKPDLARRLWIFANNRFFDRSVLKAARQRGLDGPSFDVLVANDLYSLCAARLLAGGSPCVAFLHEPLPRPAPPEAHALVRSVLNRVLRARARMLRPALNACAHLISVSNHTRDAARRWGVRTPITTVYNSVPAPRHNHPPNEHLMYIGRLTKDKGVDLILEAWAPLKPRPRLGILGLPGPLAGVVNTMSRRCPDMVRLPSVLPDEVEEMARDYGTIMCPSTWDEPFNLVAAQARRWGKGLIVSDKGGMPEVVSGYSRATVIEFQHAGRDERIARLAAAQANAAKLLTKPLLPEAESEFERRVNPDRHAATVDSLLASVVASVGSPK